VPKRFRTFISIDLRDTYIFAVSKIGYTLCARLRLADPWATIIVLRSRMGPVFTRYGPDPAS
jgi:hypothetical protein